MKYTVVRSISDLGNYDKNIKPLLKNRKNILLINDDDKITSALLPKSVYVLWESTIRQYFKENIEKADNKSSYTVSQAVQRLKISNMTNLLMKLLNQHLNLTHIRLYMDKLQIEVSHKWITESLKSVTPKDVHNWLNYWVGRNRLFDFKQTARLDAKESTATGYVTLGGRTFRISAAYHTIFHDKYDSFSMKRIN